MTISRTPSPSSKGSTGSCPNTPVSKLKSQSKRSSSSPAGPRFRRKSKEKAIIEALEKNDLDTLKQLAISKEGFVSNRIRQLTWPKLLGINKSEKIPRPDTDVLHSHRDYNQVVLDVNRSAKRFPPGMDEEVRLSYQDQLIDVIMRVLVNNKDLHYYQGYHDVCVTFLLVLGEELTVSLMDTLSKSHLKDFMEANMDKTNHLLDYLFPLIGRVSLDLRRFLEKSEVGTIFALSWLITWFGHVLNDFSSIVRLYDFFIACHPIMPVYLGATVVLERRLEILECECEMPYVHKLLSTIPENLSLEKLVSSAGLLFIRFPPSTIEFDALVLLERRKQEQRDREIFIEKYKRKQIIKSKSMPELRDSLHWVTIIKWTFGGVIVAAAFTAISKNFGALNWIL